MNPSRKQNGVFNDTNLNNIRANKNSNTAGGPIAKAVDIQARRMQRSPAWKKRSKLGEHLERQPVGFLKAQNLRSHCQPSKESETQSPIRRIPNKKAPTIPSAHLERARILPNGQRDSVRSTSPPYLPPHWQTQVRQLPNQCQAGLALSPSRKSWPPHQTKI